ncbi:MAG TPA: radical SAM protein [Dissulfurispiraceae bacterium]|nr:radical SAM protein [Dissulfurispiraceae bacterium]
MSIDDTHDFFIQWHITERCNLQCLHCYQEGQKGEELSLSDIKKVIGEASDMMWTWEERYGVKLSTSYNISGGEPFLRDDIFYMLEEIAWTGADIYVLSNGTLINREIARRLADIRVNGVQISIEGTQEIHDEIRGKGSFRAAMTGIDNLLNAGLTVTLNSTLSRLNARCFPDLLGLAKTVGAQRVGFSRLVPYGRGSAMLDKMLSSDEVGKLYSEIFALEAAPLKIVTGDPVASQSTLAAPDEDLGDTPIGGCAAAVSGLTILSDGTVVPCRRLNVPLGNVRTDSLREIWAASPVLEALRDRNRYGDKCRLCKRWAGCRGCRAIAYAYSKANGAENYLAEDPQCFIEQ